MREGKSLALSVTLGESWCCQAKVGAAFAKDDPEMLCACAPSPLPPSVPSWTAGSQEGQTGGSRGQRPRPGDLDLDWWELDHM